MPSAAMRPSAQSEVEPSAKVARTCLSRRSMPVAALLRWSDSGGIAVSRAVLQVGAVGKNSGDVCFHRRHVYQFRPAPIAQNTRRLHMGAFDELIQHSEPFEHAGGVGPEAEGCTDFAKFQCALVDDRRDAAEAQTCGRRQPADAAADDEDVWHGCIVGRESRNAKCVSIGIGREEDIMAVWLRLEHFRLWCSTTCII